MIGILKDKNKLIGNSIGLRVNLKYFTLWLRFVKVAVRLYMNISNPNLYEFTFEKI